MEDEHKTKKQLMHELTELRSQNVAFEKSISKDMSAELAVDDTHRYAESILKTLRDPILLLDEELKIISANRSFYTTFKTTPEETIGSFIYDLKNKQWDIPKLRELLEEVIPENQAFDDFQITHDFQDIGHKVMLLNARQIYWKDIGTRVILLAFEDITERKRLEDLLAECEESYRRLFETANDGIVLLEKSEGKITHANPATEKILGYSNNEIVGYKLQDIGVSHGMDDFQSLMHTLNRDGIVHYDDISVITKFGQHIHAQIYLVDRESLVQCNIRDITQHKKIEREKERITAELSDLYENAPCGFHSLDSDGFFTYINATELSWLGYSRDELIGKKKFTDIITARSQDNFEKNFPVFKERGWINDLELNFRGVRL